MQSNNYVADESGWALNPEGGGELDSALIRGGIVATSLTTEAIAALEISGAQITAGVISAEHISADVRNWDDLTQEIGPIQSNSSREFTTKRNPMGYDSYAIWGYATRSLQRGITRNYQLVFLPSDANRSYASVSSYGISTTEDYAISISAIDETSITINEIYENTFVLNKIWGVNPPKSTT